MEYSKYFEKKEFIAVSKSNKLLLGSLNSKKELIVEKLLEEILDSNLERNTLLKFNSLKSVLNEIKEERKDYISKAIHFNLNNVPKISSEEIANQVEMHSQFKMMFKGMNREVFCNLFPKLVFVGDINCKGDSVIQYDLRNNTLIQVTKDSLFSFQVACDICSNECRRGYTNINEAEFVKICIRKALLDVKFCFGQKVCLDCLGEDKNYTLEEFNKMRDRANIIDIKRDIFKDAREIDHVCSACSVTIDDDDISSRLMMDKESSLFVKVFKKDYPEGLVEICLDCKKKFELVE